MKRSCIWNFKPVEKDKQLPKSWEEFCETFRIEQGECFINSGSQVVDYKETVKRYAITDRNILQNRATAEAVIALCQLTQLRNRYNGDWVPNWDTDDDKFMIEFIAGGIVREESTYMATSPLYFKTRELRDDFLRFFHPLIEKLKPLYGIKERGEE